MDELSAEAFEAIKRYILALGGRRTFCNMYDPDASDFDELVVQDFALDQTYVTARVVDGALELDADADLARRYFAAMLAEARS